MVLSSSAWVPYPIEMIDRFYQLQRKVRCLKQAINYGSSSERSRASLCDCKKEDWSHTEVIPKVEGFARRHRFARVVLVDKARLLRLASPPFCLLLLPLRFQRTAPSAVVLTITLVFDLTIK